MGILLASSILNEDVVDKLYHYLERIKKRIYKNKPRVILLNAR